MMGNLFFPLSLGPSHLVALRFLVVGPGEVLSMLGCPHLHLDVDLGFVTETPFPEVAALFKLFPHEVPGRSFPANA